MAKEKICSHCNGSGWCWNCGGKGKVGSMVTRPCEVCKKNKYCTHCKGSGKIKS
jgi:hypothetical protein